MEKFIYDYFAAPIWSREGYNIVNTLVYSVIAIISVYFIHKMIKGKIAFDENFMKGVLSFVLLGSTLRALTDAVDGGVFAPVTPVHQAILDSGIYAYGYFTVTPGIYIVTAGLLLVSMLILHKKGKPGLLPYAGIALWLPHFLLILPFMQYWIHSIPIFILAAVPWFAAFRYFRDRTYSLIVAGQALDGAATFYAIDIFSSITGIRYFEQHVFSAAIGALGNSFFIFYLIKIAVGFAAIYILKKEKMEQEDRYFVALLLMIMGFAPGIRDILRMVIGT
ncbi:DUF63 family protein [Candidatus Micrarchaeota archaeon]|nr:DUF63 family protein [Candidatus Micrarchaeota archaeon]